MMVILMLRRIVADCFYQVPRLIQIDWLRTLIYYQPELTQWL